MEAGTMKVFIYSKSSNKKLVEIQDAIVVERDADRILVTTIDGDMLGFDTSVVKTAIYQN